MENSAFKLVAGLAFGAALSSSWAAAAPTSSRLLSLVPPNAQIVAGFENNRDPRHHGHLMLTTPNNNLDLEDWQAIAGVDHKRRFEEFIEVAASPSGGLLTEHLLLVAGRFDSARIYESARLYGARRSSFEGFLVLEIKPFTREVGIMFGIRWLVIIDDRLALFGTPFLVEAAIRRYLNHAEIDSALQERLTKLPPEVSCWNILSSLPKARTDYKVAQAKSPWARFFSGANELAVGVRFGPKVRIHFSLQASPDHEIGFFEQKASAFAAVFAPEQRRGSGPVHVGKVELELDRVRGFVEISRRDFDTWSERTNNSRVRASSIRNSASGD